MKRPFLLFVSGLALSSTAGCFVPAPDVPDAPVSIHIDCDAAGQPCGPYGTTQPVPPPSSSPSPRPA